MNKIKPWLCGDYWFGNIFYPLWRPSDRVWDEEIEEYISPQTACPCCVFFRGVLIGLILSLIVIIPVVLLNA